MGDVAISKNAVITIVTIIIVIIVIIVIVCIVIAQVPPPSTPQDAPPSYNDALAAEPESSTPRAAPSLSVDSPPVAPDPIVNHPTIDIPILLAPIPYQADDFKRSIPPAPPLLPENGTPNYGRSKGETVCCQTLERHYKVPFRTERPSFLRNPATGRNLELDCYNSTMKVAVEYNGIQHYVFPNRFHKTESEFRDQVARDILKHNLCDEAGVFLITVPYKVHERDIPAYIYSRLPENVENSDASPAIMHAYVPRPIGIRAM